MDDFVGLLEEGRSQSSDGSGAHIVVLHTSIEDSTILKRPTFKSRTSDARYPV